MTRPVTKVVVESGIVDEDALAQLARWGFPIEVGQPREDYALSAADVARRILQAVEDEESVEVRATDLDIVTEYLKKRQRAKLHVPNPEEGGRKTIAIPVEFCFTKMGEVVIPWTSESINDTLLDPETYLKPIGGERIYFADVRELFYGDHKAFMVCVPAKGG